MNPSVLTVKYFARAGQFACGYVYMKSHTFWSKCTNYKTLIDGIRIYTEIGRQSNNYYYLGAAHALKEILQELNKAVVA